MSVYNIGKRARVRASTYNNNTGDGRGCLSVNMGGFRKVNYKDIIVQEITIAGYPVHYIRIILHNLIFYEYIHTYIYICT
jgi:hypothetical protein